MAGIFPNVQEEKYLFNLDPAIPAIAMLLYQGVNKNFPGSRPNKQAKEWPL